MEFSVGHNSVNHNKKHKAKPQKAATKQDASNHIRYAGGDVEGEHLDVTLYKDELSMKLSGHCNVYLEGNALHRLNGKDDYVITDAKLVSRVQELKKLFDHGFEERELKQTRQLALEIEKAPATWAGTA